MPVAINNYILKSTAFCNINCSYCYMFNLQDTTFRGRPKVMPLDVVERAAAQMSELAVRQGVRHVSVSFHGGEPMLAGKEWFRQTMGIMRAHSEGKVPFHFSLQTNAIQIDDEWLDLFEQHRIGVGVSLDGPRHINDRARLNFAGRSTYDATVAGLQKLLSRGQLGGILCVIDPTTDGLDIYKHFVSLGTKRIDFLWPLDHHWNAPPPRKSEDDTPYADYLIPIFDEWWKTGNGKIRVRYFENILQGLMGAHVKLDSLGGNPISTVIIDTDGSIEPLDSLRAGDDKLTDVGMNLATHPISGLYEQKLFQIATAGRQGLCEQCQKCPLTKVCGGGYLPHRYSRENGYANPSVYCRDLMKLITHIAQTVTAELQQSLARSQGVTTRP